MKVSSYQEKIRIAIQGNHLNLEPVIEKEILHYEILKFLNDFHFLNNLVFMGGTSLRLCYGAVRYSEDLDFVIRNGFDVETMRNLSCLMKEYFENNVGIKVHINEPRSLKINERKENGITVDKWRFSFETNSHRRDLKRQKIKMEIADIPAYSSDLVPVQNNYQAFLSEETKFLINVESLEEILADKIVAFNATNSNRIRYRDIWDIQWLLSKKIPLNIDYVSKKIEDYQIESMQEKIIFRLDELHDIIYGEKFSLEMQRFLVPDMWLSTIQDGNFKDQCYQNIKQLFESVYSQLDNFSCFKQDMRLY